MQTLSKEKMATSAFSCPTQSIWCAAFVIVVTSTVATAFAPFSYLQQNCSCLASPKPKAAAASKNATKQKKKISAEQAVALVKKRADVKRFLALFPNGKSKSTQGFPVVEAEELDNNWNVHVYEQTPDHTATMNWFEVDSQTGVIKPMTE